MVYINIFLQIFLGRPIQTPVTRPKAPPLIHNSEGIDNNLAQIPVNRPAGKFILINYNFINCLAI